MSVSQSTERIAPRSILRHRPIGDGDGRVLADVDAGARVSVARASRVLKEDVQEWERAQEESRPQSRPSRPSQLLRRSRPVVNGGPRSLVQTLSQRETYKSHALLFIGVGMGLMVVLWLLSTVIGSWYTSWHDSIVYGNPRTFQIDARVGHGDATGLPSHFIAENLQGRIIVIEIAGGDAANTHIYQGPRLYGANDEQVPVTLQFQDVNHDNRPDMIVTFKDTHFIYINDGKSFHPATAVEQSQIETPAP